MGIKASRFIGQSTILSKAKRFPGLENKSPKFCITGPFSLLWHHNGCDSVSNHQPHDWLLNRLFRHRSKTTSKLRVTGLCAGNSPRTGEFPAQMASDAENVSIWWLHPVLGIACTRGKMWKMSMSWHRHFTHNDWVYGNRYLLYHDIL